MDNIRLQQIMILPRCLFIFITLGVFVMGQYKQCALDLFPLPQQCIVGVQQILMIPNPCLSLFRIYGNVVHPHFFEITEFQMGKMFKCKGINMVPRNRVIDNDTLNRFQYIIDIVASDSTLKNPSNTSQQTYIINMTSKSALLYVATYPAYVRALETYLQLFKYNATAKAYLINNLPLSIADQPRFSHRGVMIDTARHYLPYDLILETIDSLAYNKLNVLHWHITDEDSFPLILKSHPELAQFGAFNSEEVYSVDQVKNIVRYGMIRGVRVIPQLDTPGHAASWGLAPQNRGIACVIDNWGYWGGLDVTLTKTYDLVRQVFKEIISLFPDSYIHLGGDEVQLSCYRNLTSLTKSDNVTLDNIQEYYRKKQKQIINQINDTKQTIYWVNQQNFTAEKNDVIQWWGGSDLPNTTAKLIVSMYGPYYLDMGVGNIFAQPYGLYSTWLDLYNQNLASQISNYTNRQNVIGGEVVLWSELSNQYTHLIKLWLRSSAFAQRMWNPNIQSVKPRVLARLNSQMRRMNTRGIPTAPIVSQKCETNPEYC